MNQPTLSGLLAKGAERVAAGDARRLLAHAAGVEASRLTMLEPDDITTEVAKRFDTSLTRREGGEPVSHILGYRDFYEDRFIVTADVLDPRPETEELVRAALSAPFTRLLDLGTGSGAIGLSLLKARPAALGVLTDMSEAALAVAQQNAKALGVAAEFILSDWFEGVKGTYDLIVSNPPYIAADEMAELQPELAHEPRMALTDEADGLSAYRIICAGAPAFLRPNGRLMVEVGHTQGPQVARMMGEAGLQDIAILPDLDGRDRVVCARKPA